MKENDVLLKFISDCGGVKFVRMIASGLNPCADQNIVAAAKATICRIEQIGNEKKEFSLTDGRDDWGNDSLLGDDEMVDPKLAEPILNDSKKHEVARSRWGDCGKDQATTSSWLGDEKGEAEDSLSNDNKKDGANDSSLNGSSNIRRPKKKHKGKPQRQLPPSGARSGEEFGPIQEIVNHGKVPLGLPTYTIGPDGVVICIK